jgi:hypothetical protein
VRNARAFIAVPLLGALGLTAGAAWAGGLAALRASARDRALAEAGAAAVPGPMQGLGNPGALTVDGTTLWLEAGDNAGLRQQRLGLARPAGPWAWSVDLGLDSLEGLDRRDSSGVLLRREDLRAPWGLAALSRESGLGRWGFGLGGRDRGWLGGGWAPELGLGWSAGGPLGLGLALWQRDLDWQAQASLAFSRGAWSAEAGYIQEGLESRAGAGAQWELWPGLALRLGWSQWSNGGNQQWTLGLGWWNEGSAASYAWVPGPGQGGSQKMAVQGRWKAPLAPVLPTEIATASPFPSPSVTPSPSFTATPSPTPGLKKPIKEVELDFILTK